MLPDLRQEAQLRILPPGSTVRELACLVQHIVGQILLGDPTKAREKLGWEYRVGFDRLVHQMVWEDLAEAQRDELCRREGFAVRDYYE